MINNSIMLNVDRMLILLSKLPINKMIKYAKLGKTLEELVTWDIEEGKGELREMKGYGRNPYGERFGLYHSVSLLAYSGLLTIGGHYVSEAELFVKKELPEFAESKLRETDQGQAEYLVSLAERVKEGYKNGK